VTTLRHTNFLLLNNPKNIDGLRIEKRENVSFGQGGGETEYLTMWAVVDENGSWSSHHLSPAQAEAVIRSLIR